MAKIIAIAITSFFTLGQAEKDFILPKDLLLTNASIIFYLWQCKHMICKKRAYLNNLYSSRQVSRRNFSMQKNL